MEIAGKALLEVVKEFVEARMIVQADGLIFL
jgi:hypothetical protein